MLIKVHYAGSNQPYLVNIDSIASISKADSGDYTVIKLNATDNLGNYKNIWVSETVEVLEKTLAHFILKGFNG